jgi:hypothetical protein
MIHTCLVWSLPNPGSWVGTAAFTSAVFRGVAAANTKAVFRGIAVAFTSAVFRGVAAANTKAIRFPTVTLCSTVYEA